MEQLLAVLVFWVSQSSVGPMGVGVTGGDRTAVLVFSHYNEEKLKSEAETRTGMMGRLALAAMKVNYSQKVAPLVVPFA